MQKQSQLLAVVMHMPPLHEASRRKVFDLWLIHHTQQSPRDSIFMSKMLSFS